MAVSAEYNAYILEMLEPLEDASIRRMFGGAGVFCHGVMIALIIDERLFFKVDDRNRPDFEAEDCEPFTYATKKGTRGLMSYYAAPDFLYDEADEMLEWARGALDAALRAQAAKPKPKKKSKK
jgi:DNA transformation protein and related proteins